MLNRRSRSSRLSKAGQSTRRGWRSYKRFYNRDTLGSKLLRFVLPAVTRVEIFGLIAFMVVIAGAYFYLRDHPSTEKRLFGSSHSSSATTSRSPARQSTSPAATPSARSPSPSISSRPPSGFPTSEAPGVPPADLAGQAVSFLNRYYRQSASDTPASRQALLKQIVPPQLISKLDHMVADQGYKTTPLVDVANMHSQTLARGEIYLTTPVAITSTDKGGGLSQRLVDSRSTWQPHGKGWVLVFFSDKDSASGR